MCLGGQVCRGRRERNWHHPSWAHSNLNSSPTLVDICRQFQMSFLPSLSFYSLFLFPSFQHFSWPLLNHPPPPHTLVGDLALTLLLEEFRNGGVQFPSLHHHIPSLNHFSDEGKSKGKTNHVGNLISKKSVKQLKYHWEKQFRREKYKMKTNNHKNQKKKEEIYNIYNYTNHRPTASLQSGNTWSKISS